MNRLVVACFALAALIALAVASVSIRSDAASIFGPGGAELGSLDTPAGREVIVALEGAPTARNEAARAVAALLKTDPLVGTVRIGPTEPSQAFSDWLWLNRFQLSAPEFDAAAMAEQLTEARSVMTSAEGMMLGDRLLRDPTGSYARLMRRFQAQASRFVQRKGIWQSKDDTAALVFITLADRVFETNETAELVARVRAIPQSASITIHLLGPRVVAAEISADTARASTFVGVLAGVLLLVWLVWSLRALSALLRVLMPLALGFAAATLAVQAAFGSVHVIALGFGGALTGLALDYPLHLLGHGGEGRRHAGRLILVGATTTAVAFLAMMGSGVIALMQTGVFVAVGLLVAAIAARLLVGGGPVPLRTVPLERLTWRLPLKPWIEGAFAVGGALVALSAGLPEAKALFDPPERVTNSIERMREMIDLPSGRHAISVGGASFYDLLREETALVPALDAAIEDGALQGYTMLAHVFGEGPSEDELPSAETFEVAAKAALRQAGLAESFASKQADAYREALAHPTAGLPEPPELRAMQSALQLGKDGTARELVRLTGATDLDRIVQAIDGHPSATLIDLAAPIEKGLVDLRQQVILWLGIGAFGAIACLLVGLRDGRMAARIAFTSSAALGLTVGILTLVGGAVGIFQIVALTLVVGIGVDYGLFLQSAKDSRSRTTAARSVAICAGSTLIAFTVMAFSDVKLLHEIGLTVSLGVLAMLMLNLAQPNQPETE